MHARGVGKESPSHGFAVPAPLGKRAEEDGGTDCHSQCAHWLRNDRVFHGVQGKAGRVVREADPYGGVTRSAGKRDDVGIVPYGGLQEVRLNGSSGRPTPTEAYLAVRRGGALLPTVVPTD